MGAGLPGDLTWYMFLRDEGAFIGALVALVAGGLAYRAALVQVRVGRETAREAIDRRRHAFALAVAGAAREIAAVAPSNARHEDKLYDEIAIPVILRSDWDTLSLLDRPAQQMVGSLVAALELFNSLVSAGADRPSKNQARQWLESIQAEAECLRAMLAEFTMRIRPNFEDALSD